MRDLLTILACALIVVLTTALVGPYLVDWTAQRALIEARLSQALGARVHVEGAISLTLLPTPSLSVGRVAVASAAPGGPSLTAERADFELAVTPLMRGEIQFMRADLERPVLRLSLRPDGGLILPGAPSALPQKIDFDQVSLRDATLILARASAGAPWTLRHVDLQAQAASLAGPFSGAGSIGEGAEKLNFRFDAGARRANSIPLQASLGATASTPTATLDGALLLAPAGAATKLTYQGAVSTGGVAKLPSFADLAWRFNGDLRVDADGLALDKGDLRIGPDDGGIEASASGNAAFSPGAPIAASLVAQQIDMDRFLKSLGAKAGARLIDAFENAVSDGALFDHAPRPLRLSLTTPALTLGDETLAATRLGLDLDKGAPARIVLQSQGPGGAHLAWDGTLETGPAAVLRGRLDFGADETDRFADWLALAFPDAAARLKSAPFQALAFRGDVDISEAGFDARDLVLTADRTVLRGAAAFTKAIGSQRARLYADLQSDALDLDALPDLSGPARSARDMDLALSLDARAVRLAHFGQGMVDAGRIVVSLHRTGSELRLDKLSLADLGGANLSATGVADGHGARLDASLDAERLDELAAVVSRVAPGPFAEALAARAVALSPARLALHVQAVRDEDGSYRPISFSLQGSARDAQASGALRPDSADPKRLDLDFDLRGPDSSILLRQLGFDALPLADTGAGRIQIRARSQPGGDLAATIAASLAGADISFVGDVANWTTVPSAQGRLTLNSQDATPFLRLMTIVLPDASLTLPLSVAAAARAQAGDLSLSNISGAVAGDGVAGEIALKSSAGDGARLTGALSVDRLSLTTLAGLALGPPALAQAGTLWSGAKFAPGLAAPPPTDLALSAKAFDLAPGWSGADASLRLKLGSGLVGLDDMRMKIGAGTLSGALDLRRDGPSASITAELATQNLRIDRPFFSGLVSAKANFAATGASALDLVNGLAGSGSAAVADLRIARTAPGSLARLLAMSDDENFKVEAPSVESMLAGELDDGPLDLGARAFDLEAAGGVLRLASPSAGSTNALAARGDLRLSLDLRNLAVEERIALTAVTAPKDWPESEPPSFAVLWRASRPSAAAVRTIEADGLIGDLSTRAAAREAARIAALDADIQERAFFERRMKGLEFMHRREKEVEAWKAEQARRAKAAADASANRATDAQPPATSLVGAPAPLVPSPAPPQPPAGLGQDPLSSGRF